MFLQMRSKPKCTYVSNFKGIQRLVFDSWDGACSFASCDFTDFRGSAHIRNCRTGHFSFLLLGWFFSYKKHDFSTLLQFTFNIGLTFSSFWGRQEYVIQLGLLLAVLGLVLKIKCLIAVPLVEMQWNLGCLRDYSVWWGSFYIWDISTLLPSKIFWEGNNYLRMESLVVFYANYFFI